MSNIEYKKKWLHVELPETRYVEAWNLQKDLVQARAGGKIGHDVVLSLEHPRVFTVGRRGGRENLTVSEDFLKQEGIPIVEVERGGDITYHGPGQLVVYPIINLENAGLKIDQYMSRLESVMLKTAAEWGVNANRNSLNRGIWVGDKKLGSIGIAVRRGITFHGLALNVNVSLEPFDWINPCGLHGIGMTSLEQDLRKTLPIDGVRETMMRNIEAVFGIQLVKTALRELRRQIEGKEIIRSATTQPDRRGFLGEGGN